MLYEHHPVGMIEGIMFDEFLECDLEVTWLGLFQLFNIRLPLEKSFLKTELFYWYDEFIRSQLYPFSN